jgi:hypothetical protein
MALNFKIITQKQNRDSIVIHLSGDFDGTSAWELIHTLNDYSGRYDLIEVSTHGLKELVPFGCSTLEKNAGPLKKTSSRYVVTGPKAPLLSNAAPFMIQRT